jgi:hypothetical protein
MPLLHFPVHSLVYLSRVTQADHTNYKALWCIPCPGGSRSHSHTHASSSAYVTRTLARTGNPGIKRGGSSSDVTVGGLKVIGTISELIVLLEVSRLQSLEFLDLQAGQRTTTAAVESQGPPALNLVCLAGLCCSLSFVSSSSCASCLRVAS